MGRDCGWLALMAGIACVLILPPTSLILKKKNSGGADFIFIPERPPRTMPWEDNMCAEIHRVSDQIKLEKATF